MAFKMGLQVILSGVESHKSLRSGGKYYYPLRRIYDNIRYTMIKLFTPDISLDLSVKKMNDTMKYDILVPKVLVCRTSGI